MNNAAFLKALHKAVTTMQGRDAESVRAMKGDSLESHVVAAGAAAGFVRRSSVTQVEWTDEGAEAARATLVWS